jgi:hypothetical protein
VYLVPAKINSFNSIPTISDVGRAKRTRKWVDRGCAAGTGYGLLIYRLRTSAAFTNSQIIDGN